MADPIWLTCNPQWRCYSYLTSFPSSLSSFRPGLGVPCRSVVSGRSFVACGFAAPASVRTHKRLGSSRGIYLHAWWTHLRILRNSSQIHASVTETEQPKWWEKNAGPNMIDIHSTQEFLNALSEAGDRLVIVEFYGTWCASCRALFPKLCRTAVEHPDILFLKINFDENKPMCKNLNVKVLPYFHFYRGADGRLEAFSCSLAKFQKIKDAIELHNTARCSIGPPAGVGDVNLESPSPPKEKLAESSGS